MILFIFSFISAQNFNEYYKIDLNYYGGEFVVNSLNIELSDISIKNYFGFYLAEIIDFENKTLNWTYFNIPNKIFYDTLDENGTINYGGLLELNETNFTIYVPYYPMAKEIIIYDENLTEKLKIDVSMYSKISKEELEKQTLEKPEITKEEKAELEKAETFTEKLARNWWILAIILLILVIVLIRGFKRKK